MKLLQDADAYRVAITDFIEGRSTADAFTSRFFHLWRCDGADGAVKPLSACSPRPADEAGLYGLLDGLNALCQTYARALAPHGGYRVSAEQFRKEIECLTHHSVLLPATQP